ncbi:MAG: threonine/serine dehydratase [Geminicoccaceae bacterium]
MPVPDLAPLRQPTNEELDQAFARVTRHAVRTPLLESRAFNERVGGRLLFKAEALQLTGSFKFRGGINAVARAMERDGASHVVAYSSGNHAQGVAAAANILGVRATIVMPADAPAIKRDNTMRWGAEVRVYDRYRDVREEVASALAQDLGASIIKPYDALDTICGQASCGFEMIEQCDRLGIVPDQALICCGGGGLTAGVALALHRRFPALSLFTVEPEGLDDTARSLAAGERLPADDGASSLCDALLARIPGELTFAINRDHVTAGLAVSDAEVAEAMVAAFRELKIVLEPGGAVALAAALSGKVQVEDRTTLVVLSGGNVDPALFAKIINH